MKMKTSKVIIVSMIVGVTGYYMVLTIIRMYGCVESGGTWKWSKLECMQYQDSVSISPANKDTIIEGKYPWTPEVTSAAISAIHRSIENLKQPGHNRDENFPANPFNMPFNQLEVKEYEIVGYSIQSDRPELVQINFQPKDVMNAGPNITVEINIKTKVPIRVYMSPDA